MSEKYVAEFMPDLELFCENTMKFKNKEMSVAEYKGFSGGYGSYAQRGGEKHMLRLRMAGGRLTKERLKFIADAGAKYNIDMAKITTCQSIQLHNLSAEDVCVLIEEAWKNGMISRGGGGDFCRNVMASSLSGVMQEENFDVLPYAEAVQHYCFQFVKSVKLPRKLKICFSNSPENEPHATFRDLGFVSRPDGMFDVYAAGGLGNLPALGVKVDEAVSPEKVLYYVKAMINTFIENGNYENRGRARSRFMLKELGEEGFVLAFRKNLSEVMASEQLDMKAGAIIFDKKGEGVAQENPRVIPQKVNQLYAVFYQPIGGVFSPQKAEEIYNVIKDMPQVEIRLTPEEGMYIINLNAEEVDKVLAVTGDGAKTLFETSVACVGSSICQVGVRDSQGVLRACIEAVRKENFKDGVLPKIHISGCPSSCSAHQIGEIGFRGAVKQTPDGPQPALAIFHGGCAYQGQEKIADTGKAIEVKDVPVFLVELGRMIQKEDMTYATWILNHQEDLEALIAKYTA